MHLPATVSMTMPSARMPMRETKLCIDAATDAALYKQGLEGARPTCSRVMSCCRVAAR